MSRVEWDKVMIWLLSIFPSWKADAGTSLAWYEELGASVTADAFKQGVRAEMKRNPSPFPPGVFEVQSWIDANKPVERPMQLEAHWPSPSDPQWEKNRQEAKKIVEMLSKKVAM